MNELLAYLEEIDGEDVPDREPGGITLAEYMQHKGYKSGRALRNLREKEAQGLLTSRIEFDLTTRRRAWVWRKK